MLRSLSILLLFCGVLAFGYDLTSSNTKVCAKGQGYWCQNITTAVECRALKHCIRSVWEKEIPIEKDKSTVCSTCLDMVKQARDQLESNQTQEEIREVLEGSCKLIPIKIVSEECSKLMDDFAVQLIDTLASQMDPQVVCSVAGLCNNARVHQLEADYIAKKTKAAELNCPNCNAVVSEIQGKFNEMSEKDFLNILMNMCSEAGSFSDGCYSIIMQEHTALLKWFQTKLAPRPVCNLASICRSQQRKPGVPFVPDTLDLVEVKLKGDLPCDLCIQLVQHLRDILISNTTQEDFRLMLHGICGQMTPQWKDDCNKFVDEYYAVAYEFLVNSLNGQMLCKEINICPPTGITNLGLLRPLQIDGDVGQVVEEHKKNNDFLVLPIERMDPIGPLTRVPESFLGNSQSNKPNPALCSMCEYFLHFIQQEITLPSTEKEIKYVISKGCMKLPESVADQCKSFVDTYMDTLVALIAQEIDPSQVCPKLGVCPNGLISVPFKDQPTCPLCLLAVQEVQLKANNLSRKTASNVGDIVDDLCLRDQFPTSILMECAKFVSTFKESIVDMVLTEFTPQESCAYINLCVPEELYHRERYQEETDFVNGDIKTNEIIQHPVSDGNTCVICEFVMTKVEELLKDRTTEEEIKEAVENVCSLMPKSVRPKCDNFVNQYADLIIQLLAQEIDPKQVCTAINLCGSAVDIMRGPIEKCLMCEALMDGLRAVLTDPNVDDDFNVQLEKACNYIPQRERDMCLSLISQLAPQIEEALRTLPVGELICRRIKLCSDGLKSIAVGRRRPHNPENCNLGSSYWCQTTTNAAHCQAIEYCQRNVWMGNKPKQYHNLGRIVIGN